MTDYFVPSSPGNQPQTRRGDSTEGYHVIKRINFLGRTVPILCQNQNGPCPLLAICNVLLLRGHINIPVGFVMFLSRGGPWVGTSIPFYQLRIENHKKITSESSGAFLLTFPFDFLLKAISK